MPRAADRRKQSAVQASRRQSSLGELLDQKGTDLGGIDVGRNEACADPARQNESQLAALDLLVLGNELHQTIDTGHAARNGGRTRRQAARREVARDTLRLAFR